MSESYTNWLINEVKACRTPVHIGHTVKVIRQPGCIFRVEIGEDFAESNDLETALWFLMDKNSDNEN